MTLNIGSVGAALYLNIGAGVLMSLVAVGGLYLVASGLRKGSLIVAMVRGRGGGVTVTREENPIAFWLCVVLYSAGALIAAGVAVLSYSDHAFCLDREQRVQSYKMYPSLNFGDTKFKCTK